MGALKIILTVIFLLVCVAMIGIVLYQEGKSEGLSGSLTGSGETFWSKNKGRSAEGKVVRFTAYLAIAFFVLAILLNVL